MEKKVSKYRAVSDHSFPMRFMKRLVDVEVLNAELLVDVATFGSMQPFVKVVYANQVWKTCKAEKGGKAPQWFQCHTFTHTGEDTFIFIVLDTAFLFSEREIGRSEISLNDVDAHPRSWHLTSDKGDVVGHIVLAFDQRQEITSAGQTVAHYSTNSCDFHGQKTSLLDLSEPSKPWSSQDFLKHNLATLDTAREDLIQEHGRLQHQKFKLRKMFSKLSKDAVANKIEKNKLGIVKETLRKKGDEVLATREALKKEREEVKRQRAELEAKKEELVMEYARLRQDKLKVQAHQRLLSRTRQRLTMASNQLEKHKEVIKQNQRSQSEVVFEEIADELFEPVTQENSMALV